LKTYRFKRKTIPKIAVLVTGLTAAVVAATMTITPAQASPGYASACTGCHTAGGLVVATPSSATLAPGASYTVALVFTGGTSPTGYWLSGNGASVTASDAGPVSMTAPAAAGSYTYTVWMRSGVTASTTYTITVGPVATTPPPTTVPPTTVPPTTVPPTTVPPTTVPPTIRVREGDLRPSSLVGTKHLGMYATYGGISCTVCHSGLSQPKPPVISGEGLTMGGTAACGTCHNGRREFSIFVAQMKPVAATATNPAGTSTAYGRCSDCHVIVRGGSDEGGDSHDGGGSGWGGGSHDRGGWDD
jgi:hypothetical protein